MSTFDLWMCPGRISLCCYFLDACWTRLFLQNWLSCALSRGSNARWDKLWPRLWLRLKLWIHEIYQHILINVHDVAHRHYDHFIVVYANKMGYRGSFAGWSYRSIMLTSYSYVAPRLGISRPLCASHGVLQGNLYPYIYHEYNVERL